MIKKILFFTFLVLFPLASGFPADDSVQLVKNLVQEKKWQGLAEMCVDSSHLNVSSYFTEARALAMTVDSEEQLTYFARFDESAEIGKVFFLLKEGKLSGLVVRKGISSLKFVDRFIPYAVRNRRVDMGDGRILLKDGTVFRAQPMGNFFIYIGESEFFTQPKDEEEKLTLLNQTGSDEFRVSIQSAGLILPPELLDLPQAQTAVSAEQLPEEARTVFDRLKEDWGHEIPLLNETWFLPFQDDFRAVHFNAPDGKVRFRFVYNPSAIPDTTLFRTPGNVFLLFYNADEGLKLSGDSGNELESMNLRLHFNPHTGYIAGSGKLRFEEESGHKYFDLAEGLLVKANTDEHEHPSYILDDVYHLVGEKIKEVNVSYAGRLLSRSDLEQRFRNPHYGLIRHPVDYFLLLSRDRSFYPNPGLDFFKSRVFISHPQDMMCLVSGVMTSTRIDKGLIKSVFESDGLKDLALVCGDFELREKIPGKIPVNLYAAKDLNIREYFRKGEIQDLFAFLLDHYPLLPISELNLLLNRGKKYGGVSNPGLVDFNVVQTLFRDDSILLHRIKTDSPVVFSEINKDNLVHELSHQWWGGVISWKSYQDQWITEGLAQFSTLFHLQKKMPWKAFERVLDDVRRWVIRKAPSGPMVYGQRILNLGDDLEAFQSVVYNKGALVFLMFKEMLGEKKFLGRLSDLLGKHKYQNLSSGRFIRIMSQEDPVLLRFFNRWVYSRTIPTVHYRIETAGRKGTIHLRQNGTDFVFPLLLSFKDGGRTASRTITVSDVEQTVEFTASDSIKSERLDTLYSPVQLEKE